MICIVLQAKCENDRLNKFLDKCIIKFADIKQIMLSSLEDQSQFKLTFSKLNTMDLKGFSNESLKRLQNLNNHPLHIFDKDGTILPSAFIPFCQLGVVKNYIGKDHDLFALPVCHAFERRQLSGQLCYEIDMGKITNSSLTTDDLRAGLTFFVDLNIERQISNKIRTPTSGHNNIGLYYHCTTLSLKYCTDLAAMNMQISKHKESSRFSDIKQSIQTDQADFCLRFVFNCVVTRI